MPINLPVIKCRFCNHDEAWYYHSYKKLLLQVSEEKSAIINDLSCLQCDKCGRMVLDEPARARINLELKRFDLLGIASNAATKEDFRILNSVKLYDYGGHHHYCVVSLSKYGTSNSIETYL